jgi:quercetin dioxygenase-like cupin family protein
MGAKPQPYTLAQEDASAIWFLGLPTFVKATGAQTGGAFGLIEQTVPASFASPYHVHHNEDESFYVLEGEVDFVCDKKWWKGGPGAYLFLPRNIPHGFKVRGSAPAKLLILATPAGFEQFVVEMSEPAKDLTHPPPGPPDMQKLTGLAAKYSIDILGPLPE